MTTTEPESAIDLSRAAYLDWAGAVTSCLCALHCAFLPVVAAAMPLAGLEVLSGGRTEAALIGTSVALGAISIGLGFRRHRSKNALVVLAIGLGLLGMGRLSEALDAEALGMGAVVLGGLAIVGSHLLNRRLCRSCPERQGPAHEARTVKPVGSVATGEVGPGRSPPTRPRQIPTPAASGNVYEASLRLGGGPSDLTRIIDPRL